MLCCPQDKGNWVKADLPHHLHPPQGLSMKSLDESEAAAPAAEPVRLDAALSRQEFLAFGAGTVGMLTALSFGCARGANVSLIIFDTAEGLLVVKSTHSVGYLPCELACTEFNDGRTQPFLA
jgi:hypothetical protein